MPEEAKKEKTVEITKEKFRDIVVDVMSHSKLADAAKNNPFMVLVVPVVAVEIERRLFGEEEE